LYYSKYSTRKAQEDILSTKDLIALMTKMNLKGYCNNISIPLTNPLEQPEQQLPISPHLLGCLIGDGGFTSTSITFSTADKELIQTLSSQLDDGYKFQYQSNYDYRLIHSEYEPRQKLDGFFNKYRKALNDLNLLGCNSFTKFIPEIYKKGSLFQRKELLKGLLDTDGTVCQQQKISFCSTSYQLTKDVQELVWSLGGCASIYKRSSSYLYKNQKLKGTIAYDLHIVLPEMDDVFSLTRKQDRCREIYGDGRIELRRRVKSIELTSHEEAQCILIDHPDHLYITDDYVVTHNTTFVKDFSKLSGIPAIIIEVPHITEEHMINIPFIVFDPQNGSTKSDSLRMVDKNSPNSPKSKDSHDYKLVLAQSNLYTQIISKPPLNDQTYMQGMLKMPAGIQQMYANMGGTTEKIPDDIAEARHKYKTILFLDEFFRATSMRIRNILRDLLNHQLGMHNVPKNVYIIYASNMSDSGGTVEEKLTNTDFQQINYKAPTKNEWFEWLEDQCETKYNIELNPAIMDKFKKILKDEDISFTDQDIEGGVRTSPRRWEQILLYINAALPAKSKREAQALMTNIRNNFIHYSEGKHSKLAPKVVKAVAELITETSGITIDPKEVLPSTDWRVQLGHMIDMQKKIGEHRKHIPVLSGPPGIGKFQTLGSKILTPAGWTTMGEIKVGDNVITPSGEISKVQKLFPQGKQDIYTITFHDGSSTECGLDHLWKVYYTPTGEGTKKRGTRGKTQPAIVTTEKIISLLDSRIKSKNLTAVSIPLLTPFKNKDKALPINPYVLGVLIGDGGLTGTSVTFTSIDNEIINNVKQLLPSFSIQSTDFGIQEWSITDPQIKNLGGKIGHTPNRLKVSLVDCGLWNKKSFQKFIPKIYKQGSIEQRWELLQGLMDTDGTVTKQGKCSFTSTSQQLAKDVQEIVWSLGGCASITEKYPMFTYKGEKKSGRTAYEVSVTTPNPKKLFKLSRKKERCLDLHGDGRIELRRRVKSIELTSHEEAQCILIDHPDHLYITDDYIVTHNTSFAATVAREHGLLLINVSCDKLSPEDVLGMPLPSNKIDPEHPDIDVQFSEPPLFKLIMNKIDDATKELQKDLRKNNPDDWQQNFSEFENQKYKYLIFFDEMNRPESPKTFNGLRRVILEKDFGPAGQKSGEPLKLPDAAITMAAINPKGTGIQELTEHFRDVSDFIEADATWPELKKWMKEQNPEDLQKVGPDVRKSAMHIIDEFVEKFKTKGDFPLDQAPFYLEGGAAEPIYVSSRRYMGLYSTLCRYMSRSLKKLLRQPDITPDEVREGLDTQVYEAIEEMINHSLHQAGIIKEANDYLEPIRQWVGQLPASVYGGLLTTKIHHHQSLADVLQKYLTGSDPIKMPEDSHLQNLNDSVDDADVIDQFRNLIENTIKEPSDVKKLVLDKTEDEIVMNNEKLSKNPAVKVSHLENFARTLMYTLHKLEYTNSRVQIIGKAMQNAMSRLYDKLDGAGKLNDEMKEEFEEFVLKFRQRLLKLFKDLPA
jgi:intein/homing endonuclease/MoxR-like ATPase